MKRVVLVITLLISMNSIAAERPSILENLRPYVEQYLGNDIANKIWGSKEVTLPLPPIPKLTNNATSTAVYDKKRVKNVSYTKEQLAQYNSNFVSELIEATREVKANRNDVVRWFGTLDQGANREGVYRAMVLDQYYSRLENYNQSLTSANLEFALMAFKKYTGKDVKKTSLEKINHYSLKRIFTERCLDVLDALLIKNEEHFYDWYAVYSAELAKKYTIFENKLRKSTNPLVHKRWAKKVPFQFVKSEVIIKTHKLINALQKRN